MRYLNDDEQQFWNLRQPSNEMCNQMFLHQVAWKVHSLFQLQLLVTHASYELQTLFASMLLGLRIDWKLVEVWLENKFHNLFQNMDWNHLSLLSLQIYFLFRSLPIQIECSKMNNLMNEKEYAATTTCLGSLIIASQYTDHATWYMSLR